NQVVITTFAYSGFIISSPGLTQASVWYSTDGGADWTIRFPIPVSPVPDQGVPNDQTIAYDSNGTLHGAFLTFGLARGDTESNIFHGQTTDPSRDGINGRPPTVWQWNPNRVNVPQSSQDSADQPWIALQGKHVYVAYGRFPNGGRSVEVHVSAPADGGATFTADNAISNNSQGLSTNPGVRLATDRVGNVYAIFGIGDVPLEFGSGEPAETHYRLNMSSDGGQSWKYTPSTIVGGLTIDDGLSLQAGASFGGVNRLGGNITSIAATSDGQHIYAVYGK